VINLIQTRYYLAFWILMHFSGSRIASFAFTNTLRDSGSVRVSRIFAVAEIRYVVLNAFGTAAPGESRHQRLDWLPQTPVRRARPSTARCPTRSILCWKNGGDPTGLTESRIHLWPCRQRPVHWNDLTAAVRPLKCAGAVET
jgi:hypothetical protein